MSASFRIAAVPLPVIQIKSGGLRLQKIARIRRTIDFRKHLGLVDFRVGLREPMLIECLWRTPSLDQNEDFGIGLRLVQLKAFAARFES